MKFFHTILFICLSTISFAKDYTISLTVPGFGRQKTFITKVEGDLSILLDTLTADEFGVFKTTFGGENETGFYKFIFPQLNNAEVPFIFNKEDIILSTEAANPNAYIQVLSSKENDLYYKYLAYNAVFNNQIELLELVFNNYNGDEFRNQTEMEYMRLLQSYSENIGNLCKEGKNTYAWKVIKSSETPIPPIILSQSEKKAFLRNHFFDNVDFSDTTLINSEVFTKATIQYLSIFSSQIQQSNKNQIFMTATDTILEKAAINDKTYEFIVDYLLGGFESMGATEIVTYISQKYLKEHTCSNGEEKTTLERKALSNTDLAIGKPAPFDILESMNYKHDINFAEENIVLIFWATWCGHCMESVPQIVEHYAGLSKPNYKLITIALDSTTNKWEKFIDEHKGFSKTKNLIDTDGWDGKLAETYCIYATPTIFMIKRGKIVAKPIEVEEFIKTLEKLKWE